MEPGKVDLMALFAFVTCFPRLLAARSFCKHMPLMKTSPLSKHVRLDTKRFGRVYLAYVTDTKRHEKKNTVSTKRRVSTKNSCCPPGAWFVKEMNLRHSPSCDSVGECSMELLMELPGFKGSIVPGLSSAKARVVNALQKNDKVNVEHRPALVHRAIAKAKASMLKNPGSRVSCQLDCLGRFYCAFLYIGSLVAAQDNWVPLLECDGTHMKKSNIAIAFIHKETAENFEWFFANCAVAGILLHDRATFSDRGKQRDAQLRLANIGILHFKTVEPNIESIKGLMFKLQAASTLNEYEDVLSEIGNQFPSPRNVTVAGQVESQTVKQYLRTIHPTSWTRFGNNLLTQDADLEECEFVWAACPLFGGRTTSAVEGQNNALLLSGVRDSQVFDACLIFCNAAVATLSAKKKSAQTWLRGEHTVTPRASAMFKKQVRAAAQCTARKSTENIFTSTMLLARADTCRGRTWLTWILAYVLTV
ncbi:hypothetical protein GQ600_22381 [Phytophthora cactorum]|nr:hypothetical protein GQ600_22381 [Phytophthora cactorum]